MPPTLSHIIAELKSLANEENRQGMARFGIDISTAFGIKVTTLRKLAKDIGRDHALALQLWDTGFHEARILATIIADPQQTTEAQLEAWVQDLNSWDLTDGFTGNFADKTPFAYAKAVEWSRRQPEFQRRAGFSMIAWLAVHDKAAPDAAFEAFFPHLAAQSHDERIYVKKAVSWALRSIGKRNLALNAKSIQLAEQIAGQGSKAARWIASDVLRELRSEKVQTKLANKSAE